MLSDDEHEILRRLAYQGNTPMAKLIRAAIDQVYGTSEAEIQAPGRKPEKRD